MVFASSDKLHQYLAPLLIRDDQDFVGGEELKKDLKKIANRWDVYNERQKKLLSYALGSYPFPDKESIVYKLWKSHMKSWHPDGGNLAVELSESEKQEANEWANNMFKKVEGKYYPFQDFFDYLK